ncbi:MAG: 6-phosphofructokinase, partial [Oscillospiraceae bacterium]|nr:6-phosphofructokinase [Oscillospiraceae bacterium]
TDKMVAFERETVDGHYACKTKLLGLTDVANYEKKVPLEWINAEHNGVTRAFIDYALPLIQGETPMVKEHGLPRFCKLKKVFAKQL